MVLKQVPVFIAFYLYASAQIMKYFRCLLFSGLNVMPYSVDGKLIQYGTTEDRARIKEEIQKNVLDGNFHIMTSNKRHLWDGSFSFIFLLQFRWLDWVIIYTDTCCILGRTKWKKLVFDNNQRSSAFNQHTNITLFILNTWEGMS